MPPGGYSPAVNGTDARRLNSIARALQVRRRLDPAFIEAWLDKQRKDH